MFEKVLWPAAWIILFSSFASAQTHVAEPTVNLGGTTFLDGIAEPGGVIEEIGTGAHDGRIAGSNGVSVPGAGTVDSGSGLTHVALLSHKKLFGGWYGVEVVEVLAYVSTSAGGSRGGFGDLTLSPFILQWPKKHLFGMDIYQRALLDIDFPAGRYSSASSVNLGSNVVDLHPYYAVTVFPTKRIETSWRLHYLWNSQNGNPPVSTGARSTQAGQAFHLNATAAYNVRGGLWIGANGYYLTQLTDGLINGVALHGSPEQVGALGPGAVWNKGKWFWFVNAYQEFGAQNRATGPKLVLRCEKIF
jgi:hypothetical protein